MAWRRVRDWNWPVVGAAVGAGLLLALSVPPWGWWPLAFVAVAILDRLIAGQAAHVRFWRAWGVAVAGSAWPQSG